MKELTQEQRIAKHQSFLNANMMILAAFAWEHYLVRGRGAVLVPEGDFVYSDVPRLNGLRFHYLPRPRRTRPSRGFSPGRNSAGWIPTTRTRRSSHA